MLGHIGSKVVTSADTRPGSNAVEAAQYIRFALSQLSGRNAHHEGAALLSASS